MNRFILLIILLTSLGGQAQNVRRCAYDAWFSQQYQYRRDYAEAILQVMSNRTSAQRGGGGGVVVLPIVFHVVYNTPEQNIPDEVIESQLEVLNEDFRRMNTNASDTRPEFLPVAADCEIEFALANVDPDGNPTSGITHTFTDRTGFSLDFFSATNTLDEVKQSSTGGVDAWDTDHYINVWVCNIEAGFLGQVFGLAYPPAGLDNWPAGSNAPNPALEGVVIHYTTAGRNNPQAGADGFDGNELGRTLVHELGHYLGLRHTWGDALPFFEDGCAVDDGMADTPNTAAGDQFACNLSSNSCETDIPGDLPDMIENYMDYSLDECLNLFTNDQKDHMRYVLFDLRPGLLDGVGIAEARALPQFRVYPNPVEDSFQIVFDRNVAGVVELRDMTGRMACSQSVEDRSVSFDATLLAPGVYFAGLCNSRLAPVRVVIQ